MQFNKNNFDLIRLLAALQVVLIHSMEHFKWGTESLVHKVLWAIPGVPVFFVISGFLISASWERSASPAAYVRNRFLRIYPGLWACFAVSLLTVFAFSDPVFTARQFGTWATAQLTIGQFYNPDALRGYGTGVLNGSLWTIPVELQFYILLPALYWMLRRIQWNRLAIAALFVALVGINQVVMHFTAGDKSLVMKLIQVTLPPYLYMFCLGVALQRNLWIIERFLAGRAVHIAALYAVWSLAAFALGVEYGGNRVNPVSAILLSLLVISAGYTGVERFGRVLRGNDISYGVYIYHMVWVNALLQLALFSAGVNIAMTLALTVASAALSWRFVEKPALALKNYTIRRAEASAVRVG